MFEVGFTELLLISALALLVLGPQKLPKLAQQIGRWVGRARAMARQFRDQLEEEAHTLETKMSIDPDIDTSLEPRKPATPAAATPATPPAPTAPPQYSDEVVEEFYPPDHHMHPSNQPSPDAPATSAPQGAGTQAELDLTNNPDPQKPQ
jgi:sec-independent protein translocase protein TatB